MKLLPTQYQSFIHLSRYSRWLPNEKRRETWEETIKRYFDFFEEHLKETCSYDLSKKTRIELEEAVLNLEVMPSMRCLMTAGKALKRDHIAGYNCAYIAIDNIRAFDEILYILMNGTGVGFSVERGDVNNLPSIADELFQTDTTIVVADSKIGWAKALKELISMLYVGQIPKWDLSKLRPAGTPLKTFGGRSSGPEPLNQLFHFVVSIFNNSRGRKLTSLECHDIVCKVAEIVVVGGVRRSALISLSNVSDDRMRSAKSGQWWEHNTHRALANNSACYTERPEMGVFMSEWKSLYDSKSGERGIFNRVSANLQAERTGRREPWNFGCNPCCVTGKTPILTSSGYVEIQKLVGKEIDIWNGHEWSEVTPFSEGVHSVLRIHLSNGSHIDCTPNHKFVLKGKSISRTVPLKFKEVFIEAKDLSIGDKLNKYEMPIIKTGEQYDIDAYSQGFYSGDGNKNRKRSFLYDTKYCCEERLVGEFLQPTKSCTNRKSWIHGKMYDKEWVPINGDILYKLNWLAGIIDSDGIKTKDKWGNGCQIGSINLKFLNDIRLMLTTLGCSSKIQVMHEERVCDFGEGGIYKAQKCFRLMIGNMEIYNLIKLGLVTNRLLFSDQKPQRSASRFIYVTDIEHLKDPEEVFCFEEPKRHTGVFNGVVTGQSEILLRSKQFCNLSEVVVRSDDTIQSLKRKIRLATILGTFQSTVTNFRYITKEWKQNCDEEMLLGVSLTGIMDHPTLSDHKNKDLVNILQELRDECISVNKKWAKLLGVNASTSTTCVKPSGTVSQLVNSASGIHARYSHYYIRTVRADIKDPLCKLMVDLNFPHEPDVTKPESTMVFSFPIKSPKKSVFRKDKTAIEQLKTWLIYQQHFCEHKPSITVYVKEDEWMEVGSWVWKNFDEISGVSFLPFSDNDHIYQQAPYQECTKEEYNEMVGMMPKNVDWEKLSEYEENDMTKGAQTLSCTGGSCEIVDLT